MGQVDHEAEEEHMRQLNGKQWHRARPQQENGWRQGRNIA